MNLCSRTTNNVRYSLVHFDYDITVIKVSDFSCLNHSYYQLLFHFLRLTSRCTEEGFGTSLRPFFWLKLKVEVEVKAKIVMTNNTICDIRSFNTIMTNRRLNCSPNNFAGVNFTSNSY